MHEVHKLANLYKELLFASFIRTQLKYPTESTSRVYTCHICVVLYSQILIADVFAHRLRKTMKDTSEANMGIGI